MSDEGTHSDMLVGLADDFAHRLRRGEHPTPEEYAQRYPDVADQIRELFPAIALMEQVDPTCETRLTEQPGSHVGAYKLLEQIGEGAFGVVFMAEQQRPVRRKVALKVLKPGMDTKQVVARFEAERQALAMMDHPHIAKVLDAGETESGRPYFVMELVRGVPITEYCDANKLSPRERLELFVLVCRAVQHAHTKGVIHRDLKPSNVLVTLLDGAAAPKVIDFGVAKAIDAPLTDRTLFTHFAQVVGTPLYMSPEQAELSGTDVDTRSDIYSLGVLLYELLTGFTPFDRERFRTAGIDEVRRIIREEEPPRPSARLSTLAAAALSTIAGTRRLEPRRMVQSIRGDLDWIAMKALEKDRRRRYETASGFADDVERYLRDEPVQACPPSLAYRLRKLARRHKAGIAIASAGAVALLLAVVGLAVNNYLVTRERDQKEAALTQVSEEKQRADQNLARAREAVKEYLVKASDDPRLMAGDFLQLRQQLLETALPFYEEFVGQEHSDPLLEMERGRALEDLAFLHQESGDSAQALRDLKRAEALFRRLWKRSSDARFVHRLAETLNSQGNAFHELGRFDDGERSFREALVVAEQLVTDWPSTGEYRDCVARVCLNLGVLLRDSSRDAEAENVLLRAISIREDLLREQPDELNLSGQLAQSWINLGAIHNAQRRVRDAEKDFQKALEVLDAVSENRLSEAGGHKFAQVRAHALNNLGMLYNDDGRLAESEEVSARALEIKQQLAEAYPSAPQFRQELARSYSNLGTVLLMQGKTQDARGAFEEAIQLYEALAARFPEAPEYTVELAGTYTNLGRLLGDAGQLEPSLPILSKGIEMLDEAWRRDERLAKVRDSLLIAYWTRAMTLASLKRFPESFADWDRAIELDDGHHRVGLLLKRASTLLNMKDHARAVTDLAEVVKSVQRTGEDLYLAACGYAVLAGMVQEDRSLAESYAARAVALLGQAFAAGCENPARLQTNPELAALRSRSDFQELAQRLVDEASGQ